MDDTQKEAFYTPLEFGTAECVELWGLGLISEHLHSASGNRRIIT